MVRLRKFISVFLAFICALGLTEVVVRYLVHYPVYGVKERVYGMRAPGLSTNVFMPYADYWTVEGGNRVFRRNNVGLTGTDVNVSPSARYVFVLGDSYIQSLEVEPESISTSVFQRLLGAEKEPWSVLNLGRGEFDAYDLFYRAAFFDRTYRPSMVFLVVKEQTLLLMSRRKGPLEFREEYPIAADSSLLIRVHNVIRNNSSFANLVAKHFYDNQALFNQNVNNKEGGDEAEFTPWRLSLDTSMVLRFNECVDAFSRKYGERFVVLSISDSPEINRLIGDYCSRRNVKFASQSVNVRENKIGGKGHLNATGQRNLGEFFYETLVAFHPR